MQKSLHSFVLMMFLLIFNFCNAQVKGKKSVESGISLTASSNTKEHNTTSKKKVFSYAMGMMRINVDKMRNSCIAVDDNNDDNDQSHDLSMLDIISSDEGADFNCSGGFCMNKAHYHKKGLTLKRQFFGYFILISC